MLWDLDFYMGELKNADLKKVYDGLIAITVIVGNSF